MKKYNLIFWNPVRAVHQFLYSNILVRVPTPLHPHNQSQYGKIYVRMASRFNSFNQDAFRTYTIFIRTIL